MTEKPQLMTQELDKMLVEKALAEERGWWADLVAEVSVDNP